MVLHTLSAAPGSNAFDDCLRCACRGDTVFLLGDAVYAAISGSRACLDLQAAEARVMVLADDGRAAGLELDTLAFPCTDADGLVALTEYYPRQLAWY